MIIQLGYESETTTIENIDLYIRCLCVEENECNDNTGQIGG